MKFGIGGNKKMKSSTKALILGLIFVLIPAASAFTFDAVYDVGESEGAYVAAGVVGGTACIEQDAGTYNVGYDGGVYAQQNAELAGKGGFAVASVTDDQSCYYDDGATATTSASFLGEGSLKTQEMSAETGPSAVVEGTIKCGDECEPLLVADVKGGVEASQGLTTIETCGSAQISSSASNMYGEGAEVEATVLHGTIGGSSAAGADNNGAAGVSLTSATGCVATTSSKAYSEYSPDGLEAGTNSIAVGGCEPATLTMYTGAVSYYDGCAGESVVDAAQAGSATGMYSSASAYAVEYGHCGKIDNGAMTCDSQVGGSLSTCMKAEAVDSYYGPYGDSAEVYKKTKMTDAYEATSFSAAKHNDQIAITLDHAEAGYVNAHGGAYVLANIDTKQGAYAGDGYSAHAGQMSVLSGGQHVIAASGATNGEGAAGTITGAWCGGHVATIQGAEAGCKTVEADQLNLAHGYGVFAASGAVDYDKCGNVDKFAGTGVIGCGTLATAQGAVWKDKPKCKGGDKVKAGQITWYSGIGCAGSIGTNGHICPDDVAGGCDAGTGVVITGACANNCHDGAFLYNIDLDAP